MYNRLFKKSKHSFYLKIASILLFGIFIAFGCSSSSGGVGKTEYDLRLGAWSGQDISFAISQGSYLINDLTVTYRGTLCNDHYEETETIQDIITVTNNKFSYEYSDESNSLTISGEFISATEVEIEVSWSRYDDQCDATDERTSIFTATKSIGTYYRDSDEDGYGDPDVSIEYETQPSGYVSDNTDCDDSDGDVHPGAIEICGDGIDQDCNEEDLACSYPDTLIDTISVGSLPQLLSITPDGNYVYVANFNDDTLSVIQTSNNTVIDTISVGDGPIAVAITPDGNYVYVTNSGNDSVSLIQTSNNTVVGNILVGDYPDGLAITPDGNYVYVANWNDDSVSVIQTSSNAVVGTITVGDGPIEVAITPDGNYVYVANFADNTLSVIQASSNTVVGTITVDIFPTGFALTPDGNYVYVTNSGSDNVSVIQASSNNVVDTISVGDYPIGLTITPNGNYIYVANYLDDTISIIQVSNDTVVDTISVGEEPVWIAITPDGNYVYVVDQKGNVSVLGF